MAIVSLAGSARRYPLLLFLLIGMWAASAACAGSIFDDDYIPAAPRPATAVKAPTTQPIATPPPRMPSNTTAPPVTSKPAAPQEMNPPALARKLLAVPMPADQARSRKLFKEAYAGELKDRTPAGRLALANKLLAESDTVADNPCDRFVLLVGACNAATEASDLRLAGRAADLAASLYDLNAARLSAAAMLKAPLKAANHAQASEDVQAGLEIEKALLPADDYTTAGQLLSALQPLASTDPALAALVKERGRQLAEIHAASDRAEAAMERLKKSPEEPAANTTLGEFLCFFKGDFEHGLPALVRTDDPAVGAAAKSDLAGASVPTEQITIGDGWWNLSNTGTQDSIKSGMRQRALFWYQKALASGQVTGLSRAIAEKRIASAANPSEHSRTIDLLAIFDASKDVVAGDWSLDKSAKKPVLVGHDGEFCRIQFPYRPPDEYDFRATFIYTTKGGPIILMCPLSDGAIMWYTEFNRSVFESRGQRLVEGQAPFVIKNEQFTSLVKVRKDKVQGYLNDRLVCEFDRKGKLAPALSPNWLLTDSTLVGIGVWASEITFSKVELVEVSGVGKRLR